MKGLIAVFASLGLAAGQAAAQPASDAPPAPPRPPVITSVQWETRPTVTPEDYPTAPLALEIEGAATVRCVAAADGAVRHCEILEEDGAVGFGQSAVRIAERGRTRPLTVEDVAFNATFTVRIPFEMEPEETVGVYSGPEPGPELLALVRADVEARFFAGLLVEDMIGWMEPADRARVEPHFVRAVNDKGDLWISALALGLARLAPPEIVVALEAGLPPPTVPLRHDISAMDRLVDAEDQILARAREYFCAQNACPAED